MSHSPFFLTSPDVEDVLRGAVAAAGWVCLSDGEIKPEEYARVGLVHVGGSDKIERLRNQYTSALLIATSPTVVGADFVVDLPKHGELLPQLLEHAASFWRTHNHVASLTHDLNLRHERMHQLTQISLALTAQMPQQMLLKTILSEACRIAGCEGGSLFLIKTDAKQQSSLVFKLAQNDKVDFPFVETTLPLTAQSIAGYVATTGNELNIDDVYQLDEARPYSFNRSFDQRMGYRTRSILTLPMRDHREQVVGVLQFVNRTDLTKTAVLPFDEESSEVLHAIASQAAVAIQKNGLIEDINQLFDSFVHASVRTIEQRDPSTSGHSFRVAETTVALLEALPASGMPQYKNLSLTKDHIREVRYAALLHDFGKVGVPEAILIKSSKISEERLEILRYRFELQKERLRRRAVEQELDLLHHAPIDQAVALRRVHRQLEKQLSVLDQYYDCVQRANKPSVLDAGDFAHLVEIRNYEFRELDGSVGGVINDLDVNALSMRKGSLTPEERRAIQSHVVYTKEFLQTLPWPPELANVPDIAGAHHERQDGSGYPLGLVGEQIPLASQVMAVCDIFDALTAMDRPYKSAMPAESAFAILEDEVSRGLLDKSLVEIFIRSGAHSSVRAV